MGAAVPQVVCATESGASGAQVIDGSLKFDSTSSNYLSRTPSSASNRKIWTWSGWFKNSFPLTGTQSFFAAGSNGFTFRISATGAIEAYEYSGGFVFHYVTTALFRDPSAWYHIVLAVNTDDSTASDRIKIYVNGSRITSFATSTSPSSGATAQVNNTVQHEIGNSSTNTYLSGYLSQVNFIDGLALGPESFGYTDGLTNTWRPKKFIAEPEVVQTIQPTYVNSSAVLDPTNAFDGSSGTEATYSGVNSWISFSVTDASNLSVPFTIRNDSSGTGQTVAMFTDSGGSSAASGSWGSTGSNTLSPAISTTVNDTYTFPSTGTYYLRHTVGSDSNIFVYKIGGSVTTGGFGTNGFYLPMDGNSPIGEDKSGRGNNWTPVNFGGSLELGNPNVSGARPILNTGTGGTVARPGVFGSEVGAYYAVTVASVGGGNRYHFDGVDRPNPTLTRGATYTFDQSNNSNSTHPLRFATAADAAGSSQYTDGVVTSGTPGSAGAYTKITVPHNAPDTLHYYCTNHGGMGSSTSQITDETKADPYAWKNVLALPLVGSANDVSDSVNSGSTTKAVTNNNVTFNSISHFYGGSALFNSSSDYLRLASAPFDYGSGDFTIEFWCYLNGNFNTARHIISAWEDGGNQTFYLGTGGSNGYWGSFGVKIGGTQYEVNGDANKGRISQNGWHHIAGVRDGTNIKLFVDGNLIGTTACGSGSMISLPTYVYIGKHYSASGYEWEGLLSDVRIYKGVSKYTSDFVVSSTSPDILPDTPSGVSGSSKLTKITDGAVSFDGSGDYLTGPSTDTFVSDAQYTIDGFIYLNSAPGNNAGEAIFDTGSGGSDPELNVMNNNGNIQLYESLSNNTNWNGGAPYMGVKRWHYFKQTVNGSSATDAAATHKLYIDGKLGVSNTINLSSRSASSVFAIGARTNGSVEIDAFISNLRYRSVLDDSLTVPTAPLTNVTNTKLLCCQSPSNVKLSPVAPTVGTTSNTRFNSNFETIPTTVNSLTVTNNGSVATTSAGTNSFGFTNVADLTGGNSLSVNLGTIPQVTTIDIIFKVTGTTDNKYLFAISNTGITRRNGSSLAWYNNNADQVLTTTPDDGEWHHLRVTPNTLYFDGVSIQRTTSTPNIFESSNGYMALGAYRNDIGTIQYNGGVDIGLVRVMPGVDLGSPSSIPITTNGTLSSTETIPPDGVIFAAGNTTATNFNPFTTDINAVRGQETGYCTFNVLRERSGGYNPTFRDGNLFMDGRGDGTGTLSAQSGKFYFEVLVDTVTSTSQIYLGVQDAAYAGTERGWSTAQIAALRDQGAFYGNGSTGTAVGYGAGDLMSFAFDVDNNKLYIAKNGVYLNSGVPSQGTGFTHSGISFVGGYTPIVSDGQTGQKFRLNCGQEPFKFPPPAGFQPLNAANVRPETVITRPDHYVSTVLWTGNSTARSIVTNNAPDFVWTKLRNTGNNHKLFDSVRGVEKRLESSTTNSESTESGSLTAFNSNGFSLGTVGNVNGSYNYVAWCWRAGGNKGVFNVDDVGYANASDVGMNVGGLNSVSYDQSQTWSSLGSSSGWGGSYPLTRLFDGVVSNNIADAASGNNATWTYTISNVSNFKISLYVPNISNHVAVNDVKINGNDIVQQYILNAGLAQDTWHTIDLGNIGTFTSLFFDDSYWYVQAIYINDKMLVNNGVSVANVPSIANTGASVGTKQGFSIIKFTNTTSNSTQSHGLTQKPDFIIWKKTSGTSHWGVYHGSLGATKVMYLNLTNAAATGSEFWNNTEPTSSVVTTRAEPHSFGSAGDTIMYLWHDVPGLQKFGSYSGNGSATDGTFIELGFKPAVVIIKNYVGYTEPWLIFDNKRNTFNPTDNYLIPNTNVIEADDYYPMDFLSNGFKLYNNAAAANSSGNSAKYIYAAWAEAPTFNLFGAQSNAR